MLTCLLKRGRNKSFICYKLLNAGLEMLLPEFVRYSIMFYVSWVHAKIWSRSWSLQKVHRVIFVETFRLVLFLESRYLDVELSIAKEIRSTLQLNYPGSNCEFRAFHRTVSSRRVLSMKRLTVLSNCNFFGIPYFSLFQNSLYFG